MKKGFALFLLFIFIYVIIYSINSSVNTWQFFSRELVSFADENVIIKAPLAHQWGRGSENYRIDTNIFLPENVQKFKVEVNGVDLTFAKSSDRNRIYNVPLENSPLLYYVNGQNFINVYDHLYKIDTQAEKAIQMTADDYQGKSRSELVREGRYLHWVSNIQIDLETDKIYYVSNRRSMAEGESGAQIDLWSLDTITGREELVVKNGSEFLGNKDHYVIAAVYNDNLQIQMVADQESKTLVSDVEMVLGRDKYHFFYSKDSFAYKYDISNGTTEKIIDGTIYSFGGVTLSPNYERSLIMVTDMKNGDGVLYVTDNKETNLIDIPKDFTIMIISWINNGEVLFSGYLNNDERNAITYKIHFDN